jgi:hypothetical protein
MSTENRTTPSWTVNGVVPSATAAPTSASGNITTQRNIHGTTSCYMNIPGWAGGCTQRHLLRRPSARGYDPRSASRLRPHTEAPATTLYFVGPVESSHERRPRMDTRVTTSNITIKRQAVRYILDHGYEVNFLEVSIDTYMGSSIVSSRR